MITVGTNHISYIEKRNFIDLPYKNIRFKKVYDINIPYNQVLFRLFKKINPKSQYSFRDFNLNKVDLYHLYSSISFGNKPWITTSCVSLPRWGFESETAFKRLAHNSCKKILFLSQNAKDLQVSRMKEVHAFRDDILAKSEVLHPSQPAILKNIDEKTFRPHKLRFSLIGHQILIKGGREVLKAFNKLYSKGFDFELTIVSKLHGSEYLSNEKSGTYLEEVKKMISERNEKTTYIPSLDSDQINNLLINSDVFLFPSYGDTYGYAVLEAQAAGCPVLSTNTMALPEINNEATGWVLPVPLIHSGKPDVYSAEKYDAFSEILTDKIYNQVKQIIQNPSTLREKGSNALKKIMKEHQPENNAKYLENLYLSILK